MTQENIAHQARISLTPVLKLEVGNATDPAFRPAVAVCRVLGRSWEEIDEFRAPTGSDHFVAEDRPEEVNALLLDFLCDLSIAASSRGTEPSNTPEVARRDVRQRYTQK